MAEGSVKDPYGLLGVERNADNKTVRAAYRRKARNIHPDKNPDDPNAEARFHELQIAYEFLLDSKKRAALDKELEFEEERKKRIEKRDAKKRQFAEKLEKSEAAAPKKREQFGGDCDGFEDNGERLKRLRATNLAFARQMNSDIERGIGKTQNTGKTQNAQNGKTQNSSRTQKNCKMHNSGIIEGEPNGYGTRISSGVASVRTNTSKWMSTSHTADSQYFSGGDASMYDNDVCGSNAFSAMEEETMALLQRMAAAQKAKRDDLV